MTNSERKKLLPAAWLDNRGGWSIELRPGSTSIDIVSPLPGNTATIPVDNPLQLATFIRSLCARLDYLLSETNAEVDAINASHAKHTLISNEHQAQPKDLQH